MREGPRTLALLLATTGLVAGALFLFVAFAFGCGSSDAIPDCSSDSEVGLWWGLPGGGLVASACASWAAVRHRGRLSAALCAAAAAAYAGWYLGILT